jgi:hypothetical protein
MLFIDFSSSFNNHAVCNWVLDFLTGRPKMVKVCNNTSATLIINKGAPQGCMLSPVLYSLFTHDCMATHASKSIINFADDTTVVGLITNNDETAYREEVRALMEGLQPHRRDSSGEGGKLQVP